MAHLIKSIEITNFRSIQYVEINCSNYNLFCGLNDVGKSNVLKALNLFFNGETDFQTPIDFGKDYNKIALARAQKSSKQKQQIKIKLRLNIPKGYRSLAAYPHLTVEKTFDRYGKSEMKFFEGQGKEKAAQARLFNQIKYVYIPALKGEKVIQYLLGLLGDYQLVDGQAIETMNTQINNSTKDLSGLLQASNIATGAYFGLPTLLRDFWQQLSVNTIYEQFNALEAIEGTAKDKGRKLNPLNYQIPLTLRGEGIKSKYIPPLLQWLQKNNQYNTYIWGIDEPENSLEFRASEYISGLFCNEYALATQIFGTTHSMAFIYPPQKARVKPTIFKCYKSETGATHIIPLKDLYEKEQTQELLDEIGALELQEHIIQEFREKMKEVEAARKSSEDALKSLESKLETMTKPLVITEGKTDWKHMKAALERLKEQNSITLPDFDFYEYEETPKMGCTNLDKICKIYASVENNPKKIICVFDRDVSDILKEHGKDRFHSWGNNVYSFCIPSPANRANYTNLSIEFYYTDDEIKTIDSTANTRLFFTNEVKETINKSMTDKSHSTSEISILSTPDLQEENDKKIYDQDVKKLTVNGVQQAHSKNCFAENILKKKSGFSGFNVSNFSLIFNVIKEILETP